MATEYVNQFDNGQNIYDCITGNPQRQMVNKTYTLQEGNHASGEDWTISCLNFDFSKENIFDLIDGGLSGKHHRDRKITLEQIDSENKKRDIPVEFGGRGKIMDSTMLDFGIHRHVYKKYWETLRRHDTV